MTSSKGYTETPFLLSAFPGIEFRGVIDRIFKDPETGLWSIIDWKSNTIEGKDPDQVITENSYDMQLAFYKWAVEKILNEKVGKQYIYFLSQRYFKECNWEGNPLDIFKSIAIKMDNFEDSDEWLKSLDAVRKEVTQCRFCGYYNSVCI